MTQPCRIGRRLCRLLPAAFALALAAGCQSPRWDAPLTDAQRALLVRQACAPGSPPPEGINRLPPDRVTSVPLNARPFRAVHFPIIRYHLNGRLVLGLVDTGSSLTAIEYPAALRTQVAPLNTNLEPFTAQSPGGAVSEIAALARHMTLGGLEVRDVPLGILNRVGGFGVLAWVDGYRVETLLGNDLLSAFAYVTFDFPGETVVFSTRGGYRPDVRRLVATLPLRVSRPLPMMEARLDGGPTIPVALDTGGDFGLWIPRPIAEELKRPELERTQQMRMGFGFGGETLFVPTRLPRVELAGWTLNQVPAAVSMIGAGADEPRCCLLGLSILRPYKVTVDYRARRIYFERR